MSNEDKVSEAINHALLDAGKKMNNEVQQKLVQAVEEVVNPPWYKQKSTFIGAAGGVILGAIFSGGGVDKDRHNSIVETLQQKNQQLELNLQQAKKQSAKPLLAEPFQRETTAMVRNNPNGERIISFPLQYSERMGNSQISSTFQNAQNTGFIGPREIHAFDADNSWALYDVPLSGKNIFSYLDRQGLQSARAASLIAGCVKAAERDAAQYPGVGITYAFKVKTSGQPASSKLVLERDIGADNKKSTNIAGDKEVICQANL